MKAPLLTIMLVVSLANPAQALRMIETYEYKKTSSEPVVQPKMVATAITAVEFGIKVKSFFDKRKEAKNLAQMQVYLQNIGQKLETLQQQNQMILAKIDNLKLDLREELRRDRLDQAYSMVQSYKDVFYSWRNVRQWDMGSGASLYFGFKDIAELEVGHERVFEALSAAEFLLLVSRFDLRSNVVSLLSARKDRIDEVLARRKLQFQALTSQMKADLNSEYVTSYEANWPLMDVRWAMTPHRTRTIKYTEFVCRNNNKSTPGKTDSNEKWVEPSPICETRERTRTEPDCVYNGTRDAVAQRLQSTMNDLRLLYTVINRMELLSEGILGAYIETLEGIRQSMSEADKVHYLQSNELLIPRN